jgi:hypothetical protein
MDNQPAIKSIGTASFRVIVVPVGVRESILGRIYRIKGPSHQKVPD